MAELIHQNRAMSKLCAILFVYVEKKVYLCKLKDIITMLN